MATNHPAELPGDMLIKIFETDLIDESLPDDCWDRTSGRVNYAGGKEPPSIPDSVYLKLSAEADMGRTVQVPLTKEFSADPTLGSDGDQRQNEEDHEVKWFQMEYTDISHASSNQQFGVLARDKIPYKLFETRVPKMARYFKQYFGKMRRQAIIEGQSENLLEAPHNNAALLNPHWFVPNIDDATQPDYNTDYDTFVNIVGSAIDAAGTGTDAAWSLVFEQRLEEWCFDNLEPLDLSDGGQGFLHFMPTPQCRWLKHPHHINAMGGIWRDYSEFSDSMKFFYPDAIGQIGRMVIIQDLRYPTLTLSGSHSGSGHSGAEYTIDVAYRGMGNADDGSSDPRDKTAYARQLGYVCGRHALCEWMPEGFHWEWEYEMYDKYFGSGVFCSAGIKGVYFDVGDSATDQTMQSRGSVVTPFAAPPWQNDPA